MSGTTDAPVLLIDGRIYSGWTELRMTRAMDRGASDFDVKVSERWPGLADPWRILPFDKVELRFGDEVALTGYVDIAAPSCDAESHSVRISGRSKTGDLVDCTPELSGTEFRGSTLPAIARALAAPFGIEVVDQAPAGAPFNVEAMSPTDKAWDTIERLARLRGVLACDDERGRLVLTRAGVRRASSPLVLGQNLLTAKAKHDASKRFSRYVMLSQRQTGSAVARDGDGDVADQDPAERANAGVQVSVRGLATDPGVPRYRPRVMKAESSGDDAFARQRALWAASTARAKAISATVTVQGWRQADGRLWRINELVHVTAPWLRLDHDLLIISVTHSLTAEGRQTEMDLTPAEAMAPEPLQPPTTGGGLWSDVISGSGR